MTETICATARDQMLHTMIDLACLAPSDRIVVAGADSLQLHLELRRRGFVRCVTSAIGGTPCGQYSAGLVAGDRTFQALEASLVRVSQFLNATSTIVVAIETQEKGLSLRVRAKLQQLGFRIEAGVRCQQGFVLSAYRCNWGAVAKAA